MAESLLASLLNGLDKSTISQIASSLGESEQGVFRGLELSVASVLGAMAGKAEDSSELRKMLDLVPEESGDLSWPKLATGLATPGYLWILKGRQMLLGLFGTSDSAVASAVGAESRLRAGTAVTLLSMAAPMVLRSLNKRVFEAGWSMRELGNLLLKERATIRSALPAGLCDLLWQGRVAAPATSPVIAQSIQPERKSSQWLGALGLAAFLMGSFWLWNHIRKPSVNIAASATGEASRMANSTPRLAEMGTRRLPNGVDITIPAQGIESQLLGVIEGADNANGASWLVSDNLWFDSGSSTLSPNSPAVLDNIAAILNAYPDVRLRIAGYTDSTGTEEGHIDLSRARAENVKAELVARGISAERLTAEGLGEQAPAADNSSEDGRARSRRVSLQVAEK
jgi:outer membrane protein OmpA-like peptidoglycan-associated protein